MDGPRRRFWEAHPGLIWSNPGAGDSARIRAALCRPCFSTLLAIAVEFGLDRLQAEWRILKSEGTRESVRAARVVERVLANIEKGFALADQGN